MSCEGGFHAFNVRKGGLGLTSLVPANGAELAGVEPSLVVLGGPTFYSVPLHVCAVRCEDPFGCCLIVVTTVSPVALCWAALLGPRHEVLFGMHCQDAPAVVMVNDIRDVGSKPEIARALTGLKLSGVGNLGVLGQGRAAPVAGYALGSDQMSCFGARVGRVFQTFHNRPTGVNNENECAPGEDTIANVGAASGGMSR
jgi:hypothetical protein